MTIKDIITNLNEFAMALPDGVDTNVDMIYVEDITGMNAILFPNAMHSQVEVNFDKNRHALCFQAKPNTHVCPIDKESCKLL